MRDIQKASRNLCHRQLCWFRDEPLFQWVDAAREPADIVDDIVAELAKEVHTGDLPVLLSGTRLYVSKRPVVITQL